MVERSALRSLVVMNDENRPRPYTEADRRAQLAAYSAACGEAASALDRPGWRDYADAYRAAGREALRLLEQGFTRADLAALASTTPPTPTWLHPKAMEGPLDDWQEAASEPVRLASRLTLELRAVATY